MSDYLKVGDWVQIQQGGPWTKVTEPEGPLLYARDTNHAKVSVHNTHKILRKGSVYISKYDSANYVVLFEKMEGRHAYGLVIFPVFKHLRDKVDFREDILTAPKLELAEDQEYWLSCFAAEEILTTD